MNILITGAAGFIGYNLSNFLLKKKHKVYGIDNFDNYYSINIKKKRIFLLKKHKNFFFFKVDITKKNKLKSFFKKKKNRYSYSFSSPSWSEIFSFKSTKVY